MDTKLFGAKTFLHKYIGHRVLYGGLPRPCKRHIWGHGFYVWSPTVTHYTTPPIVTPLSALIMNTRNGLSASLQAKSAVAGIIGLLALCVGSRPSFFICFRGKNSRGILRRSGK